MIHDMGGWMTWNGMKWTQKLLKGWISISLNINIATCLLFSQSVHDFYFSLHFLSTFQSGRKWAMKNKDKVQRRRKKKNNKSYSF